MLHQTFYWILNMSIISSVIGILIYALRFIKGFPKLASYALWAIVILRLLCPVGISSEFSLMSLISRLGEKTVVIPVPVTKDSIAGGDLVSPEFSLSNTLQRATSYHPITYKTDVLEDFFRVASVIWAILTAAAVIAMVILFMLTRSELKKAVRIRDDIYEGDMVNMPMVFGVFRPRIILPVGMAKEHMEYILAHERVHIRRRDNLWRMLAVLTACIHWFNPFSWLFLKCFLMDCELACDESVVRQLEENGRRNYALALLAYAAADKTVFSAAFGGSRVKVRIKNIISYKKLTLFSTICFIAMVMITAFLLLTNAV